jgi:hypothetical protein
VYSQDSTFADKRDIILKRYLETFLHWQVELVADKERQKAGIDMVVYIQGRPVNVDAKHIRGIYSAFYFEYESCPAYHTESWLTNKDSKTDLIFYIFWTGETTAILYIFKHSDALSWFREHMQMLRKHINPTSNGTTGYLAPIEHFMKDCYCRKLQVA